MTSTAGCPHLCDLSLHGTSVMMRRGCKRFLIGMAFAGLAGHGAEDGWLQRVAAEAESVTRANARLERFQAIQSGVALDSPSPVPVPLLAILSLKPGGLAASSLALAAIGPSLLKPRPLPPRASAGPMPYLNQAVVPRSMPACTLAQSPPLTIPGWQAPLNQTIVSVSVAHYTLVSASAPQSPPSAIHISPLAPSRAVTSHAWPHAGTELVARLSASAQQVLPVWPATSGRRLSCCSSIAPVPMPRLSPPILARIAIWSRPLSVVTHIPLLPGFADRAKARLVRDGLADGTLNPRNPEWRPHLAFLLHEAPFSTGAPPLFDLLLAGCAGHDARARLASLEHWARGYLDGRYAGLIAYHAARKAFDSGDYASCIQRCEALARQPGETAARALMLLAMAQVQIGAFDAAREHLAVVDQVHPASPSLPESRFLLAWIALQEQRPDAAAAILRDLIVRFPGTPSATKAAATLEALSLENL